MILYLFERRENCIIIIIRRKFDTTKEPSLKLLVFRLSGYDKKQQQNITTINNKKQQQIF
jgi:hypothetical protein